MPRLEALQNDFVKAIRGTGPTPDCITGDALEPEARMPEARMPEARMNVYRNNYLATLTEALRLTYPATQRLVGARFFDGAAATFIADHPPQSGNRNDYGGGFAAFLAAFAPAAGLIYLADVARLEWAVNQALYAPDAPLLDAAGLARLAGSALEALRFIPHPSVRLVHGAYPVQAVWEAVLGTDEDALTAIKLEDGPVWLLVMRQADDDIKILTLPRAEWDFAAALCADETCAAALGAAQEIDASALLARLIALGVLTGYRAGN